MHAADRTRIIAETPFFRGLSEASQAALCNIALLREVPKREVLFREGDEGHSVYLCHGGNIQLYRTAQDGHEVVIKVLQAGEVFAQVILFEESRFPVSAVTLTDCTVVLFPRRGFHLLLEETGFRNDFMAMLTSKTKIPSSPSAPYSWACILSVQVGALAAVQPCLDRRWLAIARVVGVRRGNPGGREADRSPHVGAATLSM
jgi:hypothetical protein